MGYSSTFYTEHVRHQDAVAREKRIIQEHPPGIPDSDRDALMASMGYYGRPGSGKTLCMLYDSLERYANIHKPELGVPNGMKVVCLDLLGKGEYCSVGLPMTPNHILYEKLIELGGHPEHYPVEILRPLTFSRGRPELPYRQPKVVRPYTISMQDISEEEWSSFVGLTEGQQRLHSAVLRKAQGEPSWPEMGVQDLYMIVQSMLGNRRIGFSPHIEGLEKADAIPLSSKVYTGREASGLLQRYERLMNLSIVMPQQRDGKSVESNLDVREILEAKKKISVFLLPDMEDAPFLNYALARYVLERIFWFKHPNNMKRVTVPVTIALPEASKVVPRKIHDENKRYFIDPLKSTVIKLASQAPGMGIQVNCDAQRPLDLADEFRELNAVMKIFDLGEDAAEVIRELLRGRYVANYKEITDENSRFLTALRERGTFIHIGFGSIYAELCAGAVVGCVPPETIVSGDYLPISCYRVGQRVLGLGGFDDVRKVMARRYQGELFEIKADGVLPVRLTPEHPILVASRLSTHRTSQLRCNSEPIWSYVMNWKEPRAVVPVKSHREGDYLIIPRLSGDKASVNLNLGQFTSAHGSLTMKQKGFATSVPLTLDLAWLMGLYVAEGSTDSYGSHVKGLSASSRTVGFSLDSRERELKERVEHILRQIGYRVSVRKGKGNSLSLIWGSPPWAKLLQHFCGHGATQKRVPEFILTHRDTKIIEAFLEGYMAGDGCVLSIVSKKGAEVKREVAVTVSPVLALQVQFLFARLGIPTRITKRNGETTRVILGKNTKVNPTYEVRRTLNPRPKGNRIIVLDDRILFPVRRVYTSAYDGAVWNMETKKGTYLANNVVVHNCWYPRASGGSGETETNFYQLYERYGKPEDWTDIGHMYAESIRINFDRQNIAAAAMREMLDKEESEKENKKADRKATRLGYDKPEDTVTLGVISDLVKETGLDHWDSFEDFVKRLSEKADLPRSKVYPVLKRFNSRYILVDKTEGLKRQRVTILMDRIQAKLGEATKAEIVPEAS